MPKTVECSFCNGPCKVPAWAKDGTWYSNNPGKYAAAVANNHKWFTRSWLADVAKVVAATRAMVLAPSYPCADCGNTHSRFPGRSVSGVDPGVLRARKDRCSITTQRAQRSPLKTE